MDTRELKTIVLREVRPVSVLRPVAWMTALCRWSASGFGFETVIGSFSSGEFGRERLFLVEVEAAQS